MGKCKYIRNAGLTVAVLTLGLSFGSLSAAAQPVPAEPATAVGGVIGYADLENLVKAYCPQVQMEQTQYESRLSRLEEARQEIMDTRKLMREEASKRQDNGDPEGADHYRSQAKTLENAAKSLDKQLRSARSGKSTMSVRRMEDTMVWTAQGLMGSYNSLRLEQSAVLVQAELKKSQYEKKQSQADAGSISAQQALEAQEEWLAAMNQVSSVSADMERVKRELFMMTGFSVDSDMELAPMPAADEARAERMNPEADRWEAFGNNYTLREQRDKSSGDNKKQHARQRSREQDEQELYSQLEALYQEVTAQKSAFSAACAMQKASQASWEAASRKMELGMLSRQEYLQERSAWQDGETAKGQAEIRFFLALEAYDWGKKGLMESSNVL